MKLTHTAPQTYESFGSFLRFLRRRARLTQRELAVAVNYSEGQICHLEHNRRPPELTTLAALFVPALGLESAADDVALLLTLATAARSQPALAGTRRLAPQPTLTAPLIGRVAQRATFSSRAWPRVSMALRVAQPAASHRWRLGSSPPPQHCARG